MNTPPVRKGLARPVLTVLVEAEVPLTLREVRDRVAAIRGDEYVTSMGAVDAQLTRLWRAGFIRRVDNNSFQKPRVWELPQ